MEYSRIHFSAIDSTNNWAKMNTHLMDPRKITLVTTETQNNGRGRFTRRWVSPPGTNVCASFCFFVPKAFPSLINAAQLIALSACITLESLNCDAKLKWPNDILVGGKKIAGILCELETQDNLTCVILGIGLNVNMTQEQLESLDIPATSLKCETGTESDPEAVLDVLSKQFQSDLAQFLKEGFSPFLSAYKERLIHTKGEAIQFHVAGTTQKGAFHSIGQDGTLELMLPGGEIRKYNSGELLASVFKSEAATKNPE